MLLPLCWQASCAPAAAGAFIAVAAGAVHLTDEALYRGERCEISREIPHLAEVKHISLAQTRQGSGTNTLC